MADSELGVVFEGLAQDAEPAAGNMAKSVADVAENAANIEDGNVAGTLARDASNAKSFDDIAPGSEPVPPEPTPTDGGAPSDDAGAPPGHPDEPPTPGGQQADGNDGVDGEGGDPVDVVSGQMITDAADVTLAGVLPLILRRAYASGYRDGARFGPGWSATIDQRLEFTAESIRYLGDDGQVLVYPYPDGAPVLPGAGARWPLTRDGATYRVTDPGSGLVRHFAPDETTPDRFPLAALTDRNGNRIAFAADRVSHDGGYLIAVDTTSTPAGQRVSGLRLLDGSPDGIRLVRYGYDDRGRLTAITDSTGVPYRYDYDDADRIVAWVDRNDYRYTYTYDPSGRVIRAQGQDGALGSSFGYDTGNRTSTVTSAAGDTTVYHYDRNNHLTRVIDPLGNAVGMEYDAYHRLLSHTDGLGNTIRYTLDENGDPIQVDQPDGSRLRIEYRNQRPVLAVDADGGRWEHRYDERGNLLSVTDPAGGVIAYTYDARGHRIARTDPLGRVERYVTNPAGLVVVVTTARGDNAQFTRDAFGRIAAITDPMRGVTRQGWTVEGRPMWRTWADGAQEQWRHDAAGNLTEYRDPAGRATSLSYGPFGLPATRTDPDGAVYQFSHDHELRLTAVTNPLGLRWRYVFDVAGRLVEETDFNERTVRYANDVANRLASRTNGAGQTVRYDRDAVGRVTRALADDGRTTSFGYDLAGRTVRAATDDCVLEYGYDAIGRIIAETVDGRTLHHSYDLAGQRVRRVTPSGAVSTWTYDAAGLPAGLTTAGGNLAFRHDAAGREIGRTFGNATLTQDWDPANQLVGQTIWGRDNAGSAHRLQARGYTYHPDGRAAAIADLLAGTRQFDLDAAGRVTGVRAANWRETYAYDALGNLSAAGTPPRDDDAQGPRQVQGTLVRQAGRCTYTYDAQGRVVRAIRHTLSGQRREWRYGWDAADRLTGVVTPDGTTWRYRYDPMGRRIAKTRLGPDGSPVQEIEFSWDGAALAEQRTGGGAIREAVTWDYEPDGYRPATQLHRTWRFDASSQEEIDRRFYAIVTDLVGTPSELLTPDGRIAWRRFMSLWGVATSTGESGVDCPLGFPGQYDDAETGLRYNLMRYYDADTAAYLSPDPFGLRPAVNPHRYVDNPLLLIDPLGLSAFTPLQLGFTNLWSPVEYNGQRVYQRDDLIDPDYTSPLDKYGRTNLKRMTQGLAPMGPDDKPINIHHMLQTQDGPLAEVTQSMHLAQGAYQGSGSYNTLHWKAGTDIPSGIDRPAFEDWKKGYWKERAKGFGWCPKT
jgi:RHS repeat-associated protein